MLEQLAAVLVGVTLLGLLGVVLVRRLRRRVDRGVALIVRGGGPPRVRFDDALVLPLLHRVETLDLRVQALELDHRGRDGLLCRDSIRADIMLTFYLRVNNTAEDVLRVADTVGCARASDPQQLRALFTARFTEATRSVVKRLDFEALCADRLAVKDAVLAVLGRDLNGYVLDDLVITHLEQTPLAALDPNNILDAEGIRKLTEHRAGQGIHAGLIR